jgi:hypothetical protein
VAPRPATVETVSAVSALKVDAVGSPEKVMARIA